jgi:hypothetical protein
MSEKQDLVEAVLAWARVGHTGPTLESPLWRAMDDAWQEADDEARRSALVALGLKARRS